MMQACAQKSKERTRQKSAARSEWASLERANPMAAREATLLNRAVGRSIQPQMQQIHPQCVVNHPIDVSQMTVSQGLTMSVEDMFAESGTHEMGAGIPPPKSPSSVDNGEEDDDEVVSACKVKHEEANCKKLLMWMVIGLTSDSGRSLGDLTVEPYASMRQKALYQPVAADLKEEQNRRAVSMGMKEFKNTYYSKSKCQEWLENNPVTNKADAKFLLETEKLIYDELKEEMAARKEIEEERNKASGTWNTPCPWLRFYHCLADDRTHDAFLKKDDVFDRAALDARGNAQRPQTAWEIVAELYNDNTIVYWSKALPDLHMFFTDSHELLFDDMPGGEITAEQAKSRYAQARAELIPVSSSWLVADPFTFAFAYALLIYLLLQ